MSYATVIKRSRFDSAHSNTGFGEGHKCARIHGHTFHYEVAVRSEIDETTGLSIDFGIVSQIMKEQIDNRFDHYYLNELAEFSTKPPSAENIARYIFFAVQNSQQLRGTVEWVKLEETPTSFVLFTKGDL
jgi:6-pyruvoyltetrahydropterin/6-carboxytetrahydropterin synthase